LKKVIVLTNITEAANGPCKEALHHFEECQSRVFKEMEEPDYAEKEYKEGELSTPF
jgi:hypothetical protein